MAKKKVRELPAHSRKAMIGQATEEGLSLRTQLVLAGLSNQAWYHVPRPETPLNLELMRVIDQQYMQTPFYGVPRMHQHLLRQGYDINRKRVERLYREMGLQAIYPRPRTSIPMLGHRVFPYLLRGLEICRPNQVWAADITYVPMRAGFMYLVAILDWYSRYVLSWGLSNSLDTAFCVEALERALLIALPEMFNTDQGAQFTSDIFTAILLRDNVRVSMDGKGRYMDNIFVERLWRSVKHEHIYLHDYADGMELWKGLDWYFDLHNNHKPHEGLGYAIPAELYFGNRRPSA